jgi:hypothetical protein
MAFLSPTRPMMVRSSPWERWARKPLDSTRSFTALISSGVAFTFIITIMAQISFLTFNNLLSISDGVDNLMAQAGPAGVV